MIEIKTAILGCGSVNKNLLKILANKEDYLAEKYGIAFKIIAATDTSGIIVDSINDSDSKGLDPIALVDHKNSGGKVIDFLRPASSSLSIPKIRGDSASVVDIIHRLIVDDGLDLIFEATTCCVGTTTTTEQLPTNSSIQHSANDGSSSSSEALKICCMALSLGVSVILANKGPLVQAMDDLLKLAQTSGKRGRLEYSATVCGGLPILNIGKRDMIGGEITKVRGVFNATSNFVIDALADGSCSCIQEAIEIAQKVGAAEADPSLDIGGWDTAFKLLIIVNTIMLNTNANTNNMIKLQDISVEGIDHITKEMIQTQAKEGKVIKLVATATTKHNNTTCSVRPMDIAADTFLGSISGWEMGIEICSDIYGISCYKLFEKEPIPTAASMMRDALNIFL